MMNDECGTMNGEAERVCLVLSPRWIPAFAEMTNKTVPSFRARPQAATRNPGAKLWIPACAGMTTLLFLR
jgi:hypothetical protein